MSESSRKRSEEFLQLSSQFRLGALTTETSHPVTAALSEIARNDIPGALALLFQVDRDVIRKFREFVDSARAGPIKQAVLQSLRNGGRIFFSGCGSTGRLSIQLSAIWRDFWQRHPASRNVDSCRAKDLENRVISVMAGGDFALIKSVEGFEDYASFGRKQLADAGVASKDVLFAVTEGGETSFVIGTAWQGLDAGAKVYFVYNNPDGELARNIERSREILEEPRIEKLNLTTGPMAIAGSTRMQATTIQLCVLLTILEMVLRDLLADIFAERKAELDSSSVPAKFLEHLVRAHETLESPALRADLARAVSLEENAYRAGRRNNYFADHFGINVLTDTTERSPTYCTPPFRKIGDTTAAESWAFLFVPERETSSAWRRILKRPPECISWTNSEIRELVGPEKAPRLCEVMRQIGQAELMRFKVGLEGLPHRLPASGDSAIAVLAAEAQEAFCSPEGFYRRRLDEARQAGAGTGVFVFGDASQAAKLRQFVSEWNPAAILVSVPLADSGLLIDGVRRVCLKMFLNALSTCAMVRLGRVMGNFMVWVVPTNLKLIDRASRYIQQLTSLNYAAANRLLFEVIEYLEPRMKADQAYPPVVGLAVTRARHGLDAPAAERLLAR